VRELREEVGRLERRRQEAEQVRDRLRHTPGRARQRAGSGEGGQSGAVRERCLLQEQQIKELRDGLLGISDLEG